MPIPFALRFGVGAGLVILAGRLALRARVARASGLWAEVLLIVALTVANPTLWATALSMLVAIVPLWRTADTAKVAAPG